MYNRFNDFLTQTNVVTHQKCSTDGLFFEWMLLFFYYYLFPPRVNVSFQRDGAEDGALGVHQEEDSDFCSIHLSLSNLFFFSLYSYFLTCFNLLFLDVFLLELCYTNKLALHSNICSGHCAWKGRRTLQRQQQTLQKCFFLWWKYFQPNVCCCL